MSVSGNVINEISANIIATKLNSKKKKIIKLDKEIAIPIMANFLGFFKIPAILRPKPRNQIGQPKNTHKKQAAIETISPAKARSFL